MRSCQFNHPPIYTLAEARTFDWCELSQKKSWFLDARIEGFPNPTFLRSAPDHPRTTFFRSKGPTVNAIWAPFGPHLGAKGDFGVKTLEIA